MSRLEHPCSPCPNEHRMPKRLRCLLVVLCVGLCLLLLSYVPTIGAPTAVVVVVLLIAAGFLQYVRHLQRTRYRFSMTTLIVVVLLLGILLGVSRRTMIRVYHERSAAMRISRVGGTIYCPPGSDPLPFGFGSFERVFGPGVLSGVFRVDLNIASENLKLADLALDTFSELEELELQHGDWGDDDLETVSRLRQLTRLSCGRQTTDAGLVHLQRLEDLRGLGLIDTQVTDRGFVHIAAIPNLERLVLDAHQITDVSIAHLEECARLKGIFVVASRATDADLSRLKRCRSIDRLILGGAPITDAGVAHLKDMPQLVLLDLSGTKITDASVSQLKCLTRLRYSSIQGTKITPDAKAELEQSLHNCRFW